LLALWITTWATSRSKKVVAVHFEESRERVGIKFGVPDKGGIDRHTVTVQIVNQVREKLSPKLISCVEHRVGTCWDLAVGITYF
jgi:hypothetical protein